MELIHAERGKGKSTRLVIESYTKNMPIICAEEGHFILYKDIASDLGLRIPDPISINSYLIRGNGKRYEGVLLDEVDLILEKILQVKVHMASTSCNLITLK